MNMIPYIAVWAVLAVIVIGLAIYRRMLAATEDDTLHVSDGDAQLIPEQTAHLQRIEQIDRWGKPLTVLLVVVGLALLGFYFYGVWESGATQVH